MNNRAAFIATAITAALLTSLPLAAASMEPLEIDDNSPVERIVTVGEDGGLFFVVRCKSGKDGSIEKYDNPPQVCVGPPRECKPVWDLVRAAESMCRK